MMWCTPCNTSKCKTCTSLKNCTICANKRSGPPTCNCANGYYTSSQ